MRVNVGIGLPVAASVTRPVIRWLGLRVIVRSGPASTSTPWEVNPPAWIVTFTGPSGAHAHSQTPLSSARGGILVFGTSGWFGLRLESMDSLPFQPVRWTRAFTGRPAPSTNRSRSGFPGPRRKSCGGNSD